MIKDLSAKLVAAAAAINQKSREAYVAEQRLIEEKKDIKASCYLTLRRRKIYKIKR